MLVLQPLHVTLPKDNNATTINRPTRGVSRVFSSFLQFYRIPWGHPVCIKWADAIERQFCSIKLLKVTSPKGDYVTFIFRLTYAFFNAKKTLTDNVKLSGRPPASSLATLRWSPNIASMPSFRSVRCSFLLSQYLYFQFSNSIPNSIATPFSLLSNVQNRTDDITDAANMWTSISCRDPRRLAA
jgi:hypothetical protein